MSTKIYNGYIFDKKIKNLNMAHQELKKIRTKIEKKTKQILTFKVARILVSLYDNLQYNCVNSQQFKVLESFKENGYDSNLISKTIWTIEELAREESKSPYRMHYEYDFTSEVCIYELDNRVLLLYFGAMPDLRKEFEKSPLISEYIYQNQVDKPKDVSTLLWEKRGEQWNQVLKNSTPAQSGLFYSLFKTEELFLFLPSYKDILKTISTFKDRNLWIANSYMAIHPKKPKIDASAPFDEILKISRDWEKSELYQKEKEKFIKNIKLKNKFVKEDFEKSKLISLIDKCLNIKQQK